MGLLPGKTPNSTLCDKPPTDLQRLGGRHKTHNQKCDLNSYQLNIPQKQQNLNNAMKNLQYSFIFPNKTSERNKTRTLKPKQQCSAVAL